MGLAIFDLDNTLLGGDSDYLWSRFLIERHVVDGPEYEHKNDFFYRQYMAGTLDIYEFLRFQLQPLAQHDVAQLEQWRREFIREKIEPIILPAAKDLLARHRAQGHTLLIITATNRFITAPIAEALGVTHLLATEPEMSAGRYTGGVTGVPCYQQGKVTRLQQWLEDQGLDLGESWFYSDSHNDIPLLSRVTHAVAVDPDDALRDYAADRGWPVISLRKAGPRST